ncbi:type III secretion system inner membrane ring lipoprotein SctJ [Falsirhodobacter halotolerans]|uniref:type III secretion system inner membrane ring lipoprotein SctJ n=1 Tax=Falsirhodobacter halotolerans TaxID=1146892 RepID=UPI001FD3D358|nr:type III secretion inner membrane ring lipoprotein SctJ [Falsirhodobacter halotolerans]MCJ8141071.1 type III secretion inner membrane ring lipoprotein SctJ [Falsirhodobacter halotolerans]
MPLHRLRLAAMAGLLALAACQEDLYTGLDEREANAIVATLDRAGIPARRTVQDDGDMRVTIDGARFAEAVGVLEKAGLPRQQFASMGEVFRQEGLVASPMQERARLLFALSEELSRTVTEIDGVQSARVHVVLPENDPLRRDAVPSSASVFLRHDAGLNVAPLIPQIKTLVANGIAGLTYDKVSVVPVAAAMPDFAERGPMLVSVLGVWMVEGSRGWFLTLVGGLVLLCAGLGVAVAILRRRARHDYRLEILE